MKIITGVRRTEEIINCHWRVFSILFPFVTFMTCVAKKAIMMQTKIPAAEMRSGKRKLAPLINSVDVPETRRAAHVDSAKDPNKQ